MEKIVSRKTFFQHAFSQAAQLAGSAIPFCDNKRTSIENIPTSAIASDMPPELLAMEAERLGMSGKSEIDILAAIEKEMEQQRM